MKLLIREYLTMLRESGELDALLPDLLLAMQIIPHSRAQKGVRQYGVDVAASGKDPDDNNILKLFLFVIKRGDIGRSEWDGSLQAVRPSLEEIRDVYLPHHVEARHMRLPKKVVLCCGGELKQEVYENWKCYTENVSGLAKVEFDRWDADKLAELINKYLLDEYLFPESARKRIRKTLALVGDVDYNLSDYYQLVQDLLFTAQEAGRRSSKAQALKQLRLLHLCLNIVFHWAQEEGNLKPAYLAGEHTLLRTWDWIRQHQLYSDKKVLAELHKIYLTYGKIGSAYFAKIQPHCHVRDGLFGYAADALADALEYPLRTFQVIGILGVLGMNQLFLNEIVPNSLVLQNAEIVAQALEALIHFNPTALTPRYDEHAIDICLGLLLLYCKGRPKAASWWLEELITHIGLAYQLGRNFPIASDSYDDLVAMQVGQGVDKEKLTDLSTLLPILAQWSVVLNQRDLYRKILERINKIFAHTNLQLWYPDEDTDEWLYRAYAANSSGSTQASIRLPETLEDAKDQILHLQQEVVRPELVSSIARGFCILPLIASRHFRTPVMPFFWQRLIEAEP